MVVFVVLNLILIQICANAIILITVVSYFFLFCSNFEVKYYPDVSSFALQPGKCMQRYLKCRCVYP